MFNLRDIVRVTKGLLCPGVVPKRFSGVCTDSRSIKAGELFITLEGPKFDAHHFVQDAIRHGAKGIVYSRESEIKKFEKSVA